jgi:DNA-directed RNA polymerase II subunit RPB2
LNGKTHWTGNSRYSQKGTISRILPARELPRVSTGPLKGMVPDIMINPHSQPSRMTMNKILEIRSSKAAVIGGRFFNATTFRNYTPEMEYIEKTLDDYGLDTNCDENFIFPDGTPIQNKVFFGPCHYQALRHHVADKIQMRAKQGVKPNTRQPVSGRSKEGGLKVGEMERDALISHGSSALLRERLMDVSDAYTLPICSTCGTIAITDHRNKIYKCDLCREKAKIGTIRIPYVAKLLLFFLNACGIHMTFTTENAIPENGRPEERFLV